MNDSPSSTDIMLANEATPTQGGIAAVLQNQLHVEIGTEVEVPDIAIQKEAEQATQKSNNTFLPTPSTSTESKHGDHVEDGSVSSRMWGIRKLKTQHGLDLRNDARISTPYATCICERRWSQRAKRSH